MKYLKRLIIIFILLDNLITQSLKRLFKTNYRIEGKCKKCGVCCQEILLKIHPNLLKGELITKTVIAWISWIFDFYLLYIDRENGYLAFSCYHRLPDGSCGNYFWRPSVCRNYPLVDYFKKPELLPGCGYKVVKNF